MSNVIIQQFNNSANAVEVVKLNTHTFKEPPLDPILLVNAIREGRIDSYGARLQIETALSEVFRLGLGMPYQMILEEDGFLYSPGSHERLLDIYSPERQVTAIDAERAPFDQLGIIDLQEKMKLIRKGEKAPFKWAMISPSYGIGSGFAMIEVGSVEGDGETAFLEARRLSIPLHQIEDLEELDVFGELARSLDQNESNRFSDIKSYRDLLGRIIELPSDLDVVNIIDGNLKSIIGKNLVYGLSEIPLDVQNERFNTILALMYTDINDFLCFVNSFANTDPWTLVHLRPQLIAARNVLINQILDYKEEFDKYGQIRLHRIKEIRESQNTVLTRDAGGFCPTSVSDPKFELLVRKYGYDKFGARVFVCPNCGNYIVREVNELKAFCPAPPKGRGCGLPIARCA